MVYKIVAACVAGALGLTYLGVQGYFAYKHGERIKKMESSMSAFDNLVKKMDLAIDETADTVDICVDDMIVEEAVQRAATKKAESAVDKAISTVTSDIIYQANASIRNAANEKAEKIKESIEEKLSTSIRDKVMSTFDYFGLKDAVHKSCTKMAMEKLDGELDDISTKYKSSLDDAGKIYRKIAEKFDK